MSAEEKEKAPPSVASECDYFQDRAWAEGLLSFEYKNDFQSHPVFDNF